jgi:hypothetical protein
MYTTGLEAPPTLSTTGTLAPGVTPAGICAFT